MSLRAPVRRSHGVTYPAGPRQHAPCLPRHPRPVTLHPAHPRAATAAAEPAAAPSSYSTPSTTSTSPPSPLDCHIRRVTPADYWAVADVHCEAFYPRSGSFWAPLLRLDRVISLQVGFERESVRQEGRVEALVAVSEAASDWEGLPGTPPSLGIVMDTIAKVMLPPGMRENYATRYGAAGILGSVVIDTFLEHVPPKMVSGETGTVVRVIPRRRMAYLSNLAVAPAARRRGLGAALVAEAERAAASWGCRSVALHVDPGNKAAMELYLAAGYRAVSRQPEWQRVMEGRTNPLVLMLRVLPRRLAAEAAEEEAEEWQKGGDGAATAAE